jgi:hypothetical protein
MRSRHICFLFVACCLVAGVAGAAIHAGPEAELIPPADFFTPAREASYSSIASNGHTFLAVWFSGDKQAARIEGDGTIHPEGARTLPGVGYDAFVRSDGKDYLLVWIAGGTAPRTQRFDENANPIGPVNTLPSGIYPQLVVSNGSTYLMTERFGQKDELILDRDGKLLRRVVNDRVRVTAYVGLTRDGEYQFLERPAACLSIATCGKLYLRTISENGSVRVRELPAQLPITYTDTISIAAGPDRMIVAWTPDYYGFSHLTYAVLDREGFLIREPTVVYEKTAQVASFRTGWDGRQFLLMKGDNTERMQFQRVSRDGDLTDPVPILFSTTGYVPSLAASTTTNMFLWIDSRFGDQEQVVGRAFSDFDALAASPQLATLVSYTGSGLNDVQLARAGEHEIVAGTDGESHLLVYVDGRRVLVPTAAADAGTAAVAGGANHFLLSWRNASRAYAVRIGFDGRLLDTQAINLAPANKTRQAIAAGSTELAVATANDKQIDVTRIGADGKLGKKDVINLPAGDWTLNGLRALWSDSRFVVAYSIIDSKKNEQLDLVRLGRVPYRTGTFFIGSGGFAAAVADRITLMWPSLSIKQFEILQTAPDAVSVEGWRYSFIPVVRPQRPELVWTGTEYFLAWIEPGTPSTLRAIRLDADGVLLDEAPLVVAEANPDSPVSLAVTRDGARVAYLRGGRALARTLQAEN